MLYELESNRLEVVLIPDCYDMILNSLRVVVSRNCKWYRDFCESYTSGRKRARNRSKHDTLIKRRETISALKKLISGKNDCVYTQRVLDFIELEIENES